MKFFPLCYSPLNMKENYDSQVVVIPRKLANM